MVAIIKRILLPGIGLLLATAAQANPDILHWSTDNGARVYFVQAPELPMVDVRVVFDAGSARDGDKPGLATFTHGLLDQGAGGRSANAIAERFETVGAVFSAEALRDMAYFNLRSLTEERLLSTALDNFATILARPDFPADALERERQRALVGLQYEEQAPGSVASKAFYQALYGDHPYAHSSSGTAESIAALGRDDLVAHHRRYYVGRNAIVAIVGDVNRSQAEAIAEQVVGDLPAGEPASALPAVSPLDEGVRLHIDHPSSQTHVLMGQPGVRRGDADHFPLYVGNHILGGSGLVSRLSQEVREKRGLSYSVYSYFAPMRAEGPFTLGLQTRNENTEKALKVLGDTLQRFVAEGPTEEELRAAKKNITGGFPLQVDSNRDIVGYVAMIGFYGLPLDHLDRFNERIEAVTLEQIRDAFRRVDPQRMVTVTVGGTS